jgi:hypothetical protein
MAITQLRSQLQHLVRLLGVLVKIKQMMQVRFERCHLLLGRSTEQQAAEKAEGGASAQRSS